MIDKTFRVDAGAEAIWQALWTDLGEGAEDSFEVQASNWPRTFALRLDLAGMPSRLAYRIEPADGYSEVTASIEPLSWRYRVYQVLTLGHYRRNFEMLLVISLSNLKKAVEGGAASPEGEPADRGPR